MYVPSLAGEQTSAQIILRLVVLVLVLIVILIVVLVVVLVLVLVLVLIVVLIVVLHNWCTPFVILELHQQYLTNQSLLYVVSDWYFQRICVDNSYKNAKNRNIPTRERANG